MSQKLAVVLSHGAESLGVEIGLRQLGFEIRNPKRPTLQSVIDAAPDLIVLDWEPGEESRNTRLVEEIRACSVTSQIPILVFASEDVGAKIKAIPRLIVPSLMGGLESHMRALKLLGFTDLQAQGWDTTPARNDVGVTDETDTIATIKRLCVRIPLVIRQMRIRHGNRETLDVTNEYDLQDLMHSLLHIFFNDIRPEEHTPSYAGGASRMDFFLKTEASVIETKMTRKGLAAAELGAELLVDIGRYRAHQGCKRLFCLVYDPEHRINNPRGMESDLSGVKDELDVRVFIVPRGA